MATRNPIQADKPQRCGLCVHWWPEHGSAHIAPCRALPPSPVVRFIPTRADGGSRPTYQVLGAVWPQMDRFDAGCDTLFQRVETDDRGLVRYAGPDRAGDSNKAR